MGAAPFAVGITKTLYLLLGVVWTYSTETSPTFSFVNKKTLVI